MHLSLDIENAMPHMLDRNEKGDRKMEPKSSGEAGMQTQSTHRGGHFKPWETVVGLAPIT